MKILLIGNSNTGKSSLLLRFTEDSFDEEIGATIGVDFKKKRVSIAGETVTLTIWDTAGQERFRTLTNGYYRGAHGVILVYDVTDRETFDALEDVWIKELDQYKSHDDVVTMLVANKTDLKDHEVSRPEGMALAKRHAMLFIEASARTRKGVKQAFDELTQKIMDTPALTADQRNNNINLDTDADAYMYPANCGC